MDEVEPMSHIQTRPKICVEWNGLLTQECAFLCNELIASLKSFKGPIDLKCEELRGCYCYERF